MKGAKHTIILKPNKGTNYYRGGGDPNPTKNRCAASRQYILPKKAKPKTKQKRGDRAQKKERAKSEERTIRRVYEVVRTLELQKTFLIGVYDAKTDGGVRGKVYGLPPYQQKDFYLLKIKKS